jgi:ADP-heptose:LPS heptosyltransferase
MAAVRRGLVIFPGALGDLICLLPALSEIGRRYRGASVELMARAELARLAVGRTVVGRGHSIDAREVSALFSESSEESARGFFGGFERIYSFFAFDDERFRGRLLAATDAVVSFYPFRPVGDGHVAEGYLREISAEAEVVVGRLEPTVEDLAAAERVLARAGCDGSRLIVIFPGSGSAAKNWPAEKFAALASLLSKRLSVAIVLGPAEDSIEPIFREASATVIKGLELGVVAGVARMAAAFVGNDSGVAHLAGAVGASGVVIFGPTDPSRWRPLGAGQIDVIRGEPVDSVGVGEVAAALAKFVDAPQR